jgi:hypothetical protein
VRTIDGTWIPLYAALGGALLGASGAVVGGWVLSRMEHVREQRVAILTAIPDLRDEMEYQHVRELHPEAEQRAKNLAYRALAVRPDASYGLRLLDALERHDAGARMLGEPDAHGNRPISPDGREQMRRAKDGLRQTVESLDLHLRRKLSGNKQLRRSGSRRRGARTHPDA